MARILLDMFIVQRFMLAWRVWLTDRLTGDWLDGKAYRARFIDDTIDNPISGSSRRRASSLPAMDCPNVPYYGSTNLLLFGAINATASTVSSPAILWNPLYAERARRQGRNSAGDVLGRAGLCPLCVRHRVLDRQADHLALLHNNEKFNAAFRYALVRLRDASEAVGFYRGKSPNAQLRQLFSPIVTNYKRYLNRSIAFNGWNWSMSQVIVPLPYVLQFPRFVAGEIRLGDHPIGVGVQQHPGRIVLLPQRVRPLRRLPGGDHPAPWPGRRQRRGRRYPK